MEYKIVCKYVERTFVSWNNYSDKEKFGSEDGNLAGNCTCGLTCTYKVQGGMYM
jgi:hypothetical protein